MRSRLGILAATAAAVGCAAVLIVAADAQDGGAAAPQPSTSDARPVPQQPGYGSRDFGPGQGRRGGARAGVSPQDRAAFFDAHIAAVKAGLQLTPDQEKLWGPVEQAVRDTAKTMIAERQKIAAQGRPTDPVARLRFRADAATARGDALHKLADAAQPLWASLTDDQKRRLPILMRGMQGQNGWRARMRGMMQRFRSGGGDGSRGQD